MPRCRVRPRFKVKGMLAGRVRWAQRDPINSVIVWVPHRSFASQFTKREALRLKGSFPCFAGMEKCDAAPR
jgi:hypothetical protein